MAKFTKITKWAEENGYGITEIRNGYTIKVSETVSFRVEERESTIYRSSRGGLKGNAAGSYLTIYSPRFNGYCSRVSSQTQMIYLMEMEVEKCAVKEAAAPAKTKKNLQPIIAELHKAFDLLNKHFYEGRLTPVIIAIQAKGKSNAYGWYTPYPSWAEGGEQLEEITITAEHLDRPYMEILQTLHHEMIHHYCHLNGIKETSRNGKYHNATFKTECEARGFHFPDGKDKTIGWSFAKLLPETVSLIESWPIDKEVFGVSRIDYTSGGEKPKKKSNIIKWTCSCCGAVMRSSKFLGIKPYCMNDRNPDGSEKDPCACFFTPEIPEGFAGKLSYDNEDEEEVEMEFADTAEAVPAEPSEEDFAKELPPLESDEESSIYTDEEKPVEAFEYSNQERRYNPTTCPTCPWLNEAEGSCRIHCSRIEYANKIVNVYETRPLDMDNPYENMKTCSHFDKYKNPKTVMKLDEVK